MDYDGTPLTCDQAQFTGVNSFAGGVSNEQTGIAAMRFTNPLTGSLSWQKAWFFLENDIQHVLIPAVSSTTDNPVFTVLDQKRHNGQILVDGFPIGEKTNFTRPLSLWHDNVGYIFEQTEEPLALSIEVGPKTGNWSAIGISAQGLATVDLFAAWIDHDTTPPAPLSYSVFPAVDEPSFTHKVSGMQVQNIANNASVSAIYDADHRTAMIVFWADAGGSVQFIPGLFHSPITVTSNANAAIIYQLDTGNVTVSDPSQTLSCIELTFTAGPGGPLPPRWGDTLSKQLNLNLPTGGLAGSSVSEIL